MKYIKNDSRDAYYNLAFEEYITKNHTDGDILLLWQNDNTIVVGRYQNTVQEINSAAVEENGVKVVRRNTGGGAVYHDTGNLNFSFITDWRGDVHLGFGEFLDKLQDTLGKIGIKSERTGRNDISVQGKKFSGLAQSVIGKRLLSHGTLLICSDLTMLSNFLKVSAAKIESKGIKSVRARVANLAEFAQCEINVPMIKNLIVDSFGADLEEIVLEPHELEAIEKLAQEKYSQWDWNYGNSPDFEFTKSVRTDAGSAQVSLNVRDGHITDCSITGDFLGLCDISEIQSALVGVKHAHEDILNVLQNYDNAMYFGNFDMQKVLDCFF